MGLEGTAAQSNRFIRHRMPYFTVPNFLLCEQIKESVLECEAVKTELRAHDEKMESVKSDLASKRMELASLEMAIDEAARKKRTEREVRVFC